MKQLLAIFIIAMLILIACSNPKKEKKSYEPPTQKGAWLPAPEYRSKSETAIQLNDSAAALQIRAMQDPTLEPVDRYALIETAFKLLNEALKLDPEYRLAMSNLAAIYLEKRDTSKALELMKRRLELEPDMAEGWQAVGVFTDMLGDSSKAKSCYQKSIDIYDSRLKMGKEYALAEDLLYYYDNWSGKAFSLLLLGRTTDAHNSIRALLDEAGVVLGQDAETYAAMLNKDRWLILKEMKGEHFH
jgi:tetratricopeptide (TPR) repeat protein